MKQKLDTLGINKLPKHIAFVIDGNGRWAKEKNKSRSYGHKIGVQTLEKILKTCKNIEIEVVSVFAFSTENWKRSEDEVKFLFKLFESYAKSLLKEVKKDTSIKFRHMGNLAQLPKSLQKLLVSLQEQTNNNTGFTINIGINYGGRDEILRAVNKILAQGKTNITAQEFEAYLDTAGICDPEFIIRTSGEERVSNFMLYQMAYSEFYFPKVYWPAFTEDHLLEALQVFQNRKRRYGAAKEEEWKTGFTQDLCFF